MVQRKFAVVTTFNKSGYDLYGRRMIDTFLKNWPSEIKLYVYAEDCTIDQMADNLIVRSMPEELLKFKSRWAGIPKANGDVSDDPVRSQRKDSGKGFKWDAVRFSHKVYSIFDCANTCQADVLIWMDADIVCHSPITMQTLKDLCPADQDLCFLGRSGKYSECGLYAINLNSKMGKLFLSRFQEFYDQDIIFNFHEWHDSYVFDEVRKSMQCKELNWSQGLIKGEGHPLINSEWGAYLDHLKGARKNQGHSHKKDLIRSRTETYWQSVISS